MVYVDELVKSSVTKRWPYVTSCHMIADSMSELHEFAKRLGLRRYWLHESSSMHHYDLTAGTREKAIRFGAESITCRTLGKKIAERRKVIKARVKTTKRVDWR
ncbi:DUF4031 domain-containing protein [Candidatus Pacearchaeota archaeon]|nr:DUF4031 domain-containing protein [Candidatus Pacearchaeota archaeon]